MELIKSKKIIHGDIELRADNILVFRPDVVHFKEFTVEILQELVKEFVEITEGVPRPYMCDNRYITGIVTKEEQSFINDNFHKFATHSALITNSALIKMLVNTYTTVFKSKMKIKLFNQEKEAVKWLLSPK